MCLQWQGQAPERFVEDIVRSSLESMCQRDRSVRVHRRRDQHRFMSGIAVCLSSQQPPGNRSGVAYARQRLYWELVRACAWRLCEGEGVVGWLKRGEGGLCSDQGTRVDAAGHQHTCCQALCRQP